MSKSLEGRTVVAVVDEIGNPGRAVDGSVQFRLVAGDQDMILTMPASLARELASGLIDAAKDVEKGEKT